MLLAAGARQAAPGEFTRRALMHGKIDLVQAEAVADLIDATAPAQRRAALHQLDRGLSARIGALRDQVLELEALVSYDIDFPEEDSGPVPPERIDGAIAALADALHHLLGTAAEGERLREGALVVIAGRPNAGKSSMFNALLLQWANCKPDARTLCIRQISLPNVERSCSNTAAAPSWAGQRREIAGLSM